MTSRLGVLLLALLAAAGVAFAQAPVTITTGSPLPDGYLNLSYGVPPGFTGLQFTAQTNPSQAAVNWSIVVGYGNPVPGLTMDSTGFFHGSPSNVGDFTFKVSAITQYGSATNIFTLHVGTPQVAITSVSPLTNAFVNQGYNFQFTGTSTPALGITWFPNDNPLPPGLNLNQSGLLSGVPTTPGQYSFSVIAQLTGTNITANASFSITIYAGQVSILTTTLPVASVGQGYSFKLLSNPAGATWQLAGSALPGGINFDTSTGTLSGAASIAGIYRFGVQAVYPNYLLGSAIFTLYVNNGPLGILETSLPIAIQNAPYRATLTPEGGLAPFSWALSGSNPLGFSIDPNTGTITGTPTLAPGTSYTVTVALSDVTPSRPFTQPYSVFVAAPLSVATATLPQGTVNTAYTQALAAAGGQAPYSWVVLNTIGPLPPGLSMGTDGVIRGTPTVNGVFPFAVQVTDFGKRTATANLSITIGVNITLSIGPGSLPDGLALVPYPPPNGGGVQLTATGGTPPYTFTTTASALPPGLSLSPGGLISGTPVGPPQAPLGTSTFTVTVHDSSSLAAALTGQKTYTLNITLPLNINTTSLPNGTIGTPYPQSGVQTSVQVSGGQPPYNFSIIAGALPAGLKLDPATGVLNGTPTGPAGVATITLQVQDAGGQVTTKQFTITIAAAGTPPVISTGDASGTVGTGLSVLLAATGGTPPYTFALTNGTPPAGLTFNTSTATLSGTPTAAGSTSLTFTVTDSQKQTASKTITITISLPPLPATTIGTIPANPATQPGVSLTLGSSFPVDLNGTYSLSFQSSVGGSPTEVQFATGQTATFTIPAGQLTAPPIQVATGTVAGTITITAKLTAGGVDVTPTPAPTQTIVIAKAAPVIIPPVTFSNAGGALTVTLIGYSTTREVANGDFVFSASSGNTVSNGGDVSVPLTSAFATWFSSAASNPFGGQFKLTVTFNVANGTSSAITSVSVKLTNGVGTSPAASPQ